MRFLRSHYVNSPVLRLIIDLTYVFLKEFYRHILARAPRISFFFPIETQLIKTGYLLLFWWDRTTHNQHGHLKIVLKFYTNFLACVLVLTHPNPPKNGIRDGFVVFNCKRIICLPVVNAFCLIACVFKKNK